jgi:hypothetical protein
MYAPYPLCAEAERLASGVGEILVSRTTPPEP